MIIGKSGLDTRSTIEELNKRQNAKKGILKQLPEEKKQIGKTKDKKQK